MDNAAQKERFHFLDGLRGIAATMIVIHHAFTANLLRYCNAHHLEHLSYFLKNFTQSGVELFFVLSGVVLLRPYLRRERTFKTGEYFYRRIKRIYPPYLAALAFGTMVIALTTFYPTWYSKVLRTFSWEWTLRQIPIIKPGNIYYNQAWWSLQPELLFYMVVPIIIWLAPRPEKVSLTKFYCLLMCALTAVVATQWYLTHYYPMLYNTWHIVLNGFKLVDYPICFIMGTYIALKNTDRKNAVVLMICGVGLLAYAYVYEPIVSSGYGLLYGGFIMYAFHSTAIKRALSKPFMIWLGERSYSIFLIHFSVFYLVNYTLSRTLTERSAMYGLLSRGVGVPLALLAAMLLFHFVERRQARGLLTANAFWPWQAKKAIDQHHQQ